MASYHFAVKIFKRSEGANAVKAAAYRARTQLTDERTGLKTKDYGVKGGLQRDEILLPEGAAPWLADRQKLWNHVEALEKRKDAQLAREINVALPHELTDEQRFELTRSFVQNTFVKLGMVADIAWHRPEPKNGDDARNFHAHILLTLRQGLPGGLRRVKTREWNSDSLVEEWRQSWAAHQNGWLQSLGHKARVDHRSLAAQRAEAVIKGDRTAAEVLNRKPEIHVGPKARQAERRGFELTSKPKVVQLPKQPAGRSRREANLRQMRPMEEGERSRRQRAFRLVRYPEIDRGTRASWNLGLRRGNDLSLANWVLRREHRMARLRHTQQRWRGIAQACLAAQRGGSLTGWRPMVALKPGELVLWNQRANRHVSLLDKMLGDLQRELGRLLLARSTELKRSQQARQNYVRQTLARPDGQVAGRGLGQRRAVEPGAGS